MNASNHALERTADRRENLLSMTSILKPEARLTLDSGRSAWSREMRGRAFVGFAVAGAAFAFGSCYLAEPPGTVSRAAIGYRPAAQFIVALEAFNRQHDHY